MKVFMCIESGEEHITFVNENYAIVIVGNSNLIEAYCPDDVDDYLTMTLNLETGIIMKHDSLLPSIQSEIERDLEILYKLLHKIS